MAICPVCGEDELMPFVCHYCGGSFCIDHRLPEKHNCPGLAEYRRRVRESGRLVYRPEWEQVKARRKMPSILSTVTSSYALAIIFLVSIVFLLQLIFGIKYCPPWQSGLGCYLFDQLALFPASILSRPWTLITSIFLHAGIVHYFFNMFVLFFFGPELERRIGKQNFLKVFFYSGAAAALGYSLWSSLVLDSNSPAIGASGAIYGVIAALAVIAPHIQVYIYFIPMRITYAIALFALWDLVFLAVPGDSIARSAHLTGLLVGLLMGRKLRDREKMKYDYWV